MTRDAGNPMEALIQEISSGQCNRAKVKVKKVYLNEDPSKEETVPCPRCSRGNQQSMVRYMYISLNEAIYKCEAPNCMYPFRNFRFKNYDDNTVYQYEQLLDQNRLNLDLLCSDFTPCSVSDSYGCGPEQSLDDFAPVDFNVDFPSTEPLGQHSFANASKSLPTEPKSQELATTFDVGLIDDILQDLWPSKSASTAPPSNETVLMPNDVKNWQPSEEPKSTTESNQPPSGRRLEKCLKAVQQTNKSLQDVIFRVPTETEQSRKRTVHVVESITPTKLRIKKVSPRKRRKMNPPAKSNCPVKPYNPTMVMASSANTLVQTKAITPVEFLNQLNTLSRPSPPRPSSVCSDKAQRMLSFIQRSLRDRPRDDSVPPQSVAQAPVVSNELQAVPVISNESVGSLQSQSLPPIVPCSSTAPSEDLAANATVADELPPTPTLEKPVIEIKTCEFVTNGGMELLIRLLE
ncbi:uncharacterized protein LOC131216682 [Anopheles bellator]|uniref:uncharacterized protein LOC131216682 n=1 Tax=Anopheles bellator TaxID=139047 RepID=UPI0026496D6D|nr:uncharacterized protein LOC131216682 [Anopheles bellator]